MTELEQSIKDRFIDAIRKTFPHPTPLIGERWFVFSPNGKPADFQFMGVNKLAKATAMAPKRIAQMLIKNLDLGAIPALVEMTVDNRINLHYSRQSKKFPPQPLPQSPQGQAAAAPAAQTTAPAAAVDQPMPPKDTGTPHEPPQGT